MRDQEDSRKRDNHATDQNCQQNPVEDSRLSAVPQEYRFKSIGHTFLR